MKENHKNLHYFKKSKNIDLKRVFFNKVIMNKQTLINAITRSRKRRELSRKIFAIIILFYLAFLVFMIKL